MLNHVLVCTDLDRTLLPNGPQPESSGARRRFGELAARAEVRIAYVSGRHRELVEQAIAEYQLPCPDFVIGDVGTSIFSVQEGDWSEWPAWQRVLSDAWGDMNGLAMRSLFEDMSQLTPQEPEKQGRFKCSFYAPVETDISELIPRMEQCLRDAGLVSRIIWSVDESRDLGLVDVLPEAASKLHAIRFLIEQQRFDPLNTLFAGDSGNDLEVLVSDIPAVLVTNATDSVREQALELCRNAGTEHALYLARGGFRDMNGNYSAGILEGLAHFLPETGAWIQ